MNKVCRYIRNLILRVFRNYPEYVDPNPLPATEATTLVRVKTSSNANGPYMTADPCWQSKLSEVTDESAVPVVGCDTTHASCTKPQKPNTGQLYRDDSDSGALYVWTGLHWRFMGFADQGTHDTKTDATYYGADSTDYLPSDGRLYHDDPLPDNT